MMRGCMWLLALGLGGLSGLGWLGAAPVALAGPTNQGGALVLRVEDGATYEVGTYDHCGQLTLSDSNSIRTRLPGDGKPHLVGLYAVFPADSVGSVKALGFGIRYSPNVRLLGCAACSGGGLEILMNGWPASGGGTSFNVMPDAVRQSRIIPLYWFALSCRGEGTFEVIPHPMARIAGRFANADFPPLETPIADYGRIGFNRDGHVAESGAAPLVGASCVAGECWRLTRHECSVYGGVWLGENADCEAEPCRDDARLGGCRFAAGCDTLSALDCARAGGYFLGEGVGCAAPSDSTAVPPDSASAPSGKP